MKSLDKKVYLTTGYFTKDENEDRFVGSLLSVMIGDILGASVEGWPSSLISKKFPEGVKDFLTATHMGIGHLGPRFGMYTDDTNSTLALATSLVQKQFLDPKHAAESYSTFYFDTKPLRGYPNSAIAVLKSIKEGMDYKETGTMIFPDGSFANGGAMRISPIGLTFRNASDEVLYEACKLAIISSHVHPEAVDGAFIIAKCVAWGIQFDPKKDLDEIQFLNEMKSASKTSSMKGNIEILIDSFSKNLDDEKVLLMVSEDFQIKAVDAVSVVLWTFVKYWKNPEDALIKIIGFGGDTDTTASILGGILGAIHGTYWIPHRWFDNIENGKFGRDYCVDLAKDLFELDFVDFGKLKCVKLKESGDNFKSLKKYQEALQCYEEALESFNLTKRMKLMLETEIDQCKTNLEK
jgi:poly(ADP-ribose) glycohydrolase ARH3